jgi:hypothetical protein
VKKLIENKKLKMNYLSALLCLSVITLAVAGKIKKYVNLYRAHGWRSFNAKCDEHTIVYNINCQSRNIYLWKPVAKT